MTNAINASVFACKWSLFCVRLYWIGFFIYLKLKIVCVKLIRFFLFCSASIKVNAGPVEKSFYFYKFDFERRSLVCSLKVLMQQISIHLSQKFFSRLSLVTSRSRYDNVGAFSWQSIHTLSLNCVENCYFLQMCQDWIYIAGIVNFVKCSRRFHRFIIPHGMKY